MMAKEDWGRLLLHTPVGVANCLLLSLNTALGIIFFVGFMVYELDEDWKLYDNAYKDIAGFLWGLAIGGLILWVLE